jgi:hypothetical protein
VRTKTGKNLKKADEETGTQKTVTKRKCKHEVYDAGVTYQAEANPGYCKEGFYLSDLRCGSCSRMFVADKKTEKAYGEKESFRPRTDSPIYFRINMGKKDSGTGSRDTCRHALYMGCWTEGVLGSEGHSQRRPKRARPTM